MDGLIIADGTGRSLLSTNFVDPSIPPIALDALNANITRSKETGQEVPNIFWVPGLEVVGQSGGRRIRNRVFDDDGGDDSSSGEEEEEEVGAEQDVWAAGTSSGGGIVVKDKEPHKQVFGSETAAGFVVCQIVRGGLRFLAPVSAEVEPLVPLTFLHDFSSLLSSYYGEVSEASLKENFDSVYQLFEQVMSSGRPVTTDPAFLRELVVPPSFMNRIMSAASVAGLAPLAGQLPFQTPLTSPVPWRRTGIKHSNNEVFLDVVETVSGIVDRSGNLIIGNAWGKIESRCRLSGMPDLAVHFSNPHILEDCCFHPCVRYSKWTQSRILSFVPPDGRFTLMEFRVGQPTTSSSSMGVVASTSGQKKSMANANIAKGVMPLSMKHRITTGEAGGSFSITLTPRTPTSRPLENIKITFYLGSGAESANASITGGRSLGSSSGANGAAGDEKDEYPGGRWEFEAASKNLVWTISRLSAGDRPPTLSGTWNSSSTSSRPAPSILASFAVPLFSISGLRIESLKVVGEPYAPYKGVRTIVRSSDFEFRW